MEHDRHPNHAFGTSGPVSNTKPLLASAGSTTLLVGPVLFTGYTRGVLTRLYGLHVVVPELLTSGSLLSVLRNGEELSDSQALTRSKPNFGCLGRVLRKLVESELCIGMRFVYSVVNIHQF